MQKLEVLGCSIDGNQIAVESRTIEQIIEVPLHAAPPGSTSAFRYTAVVGDHVVVVLSPSTTSKSINRKSDTESVIILRSTKLKIRVGLHIDTVGNMMQVTQSDDPHIAIGRDGDQWLLLGEADLNLALKTGTFDHLLTTEAWAGSNP